MQVNKILLTRDRPEQNCPFSLLFLTVIAFHRVQKSPLIIGIVDRIKINKEQLFPFSDSELSHTFCKLQALFTSVSFISRR